MSEESLIQRVTSEGTNLVANIFGLDKSMLEASEFLFFEKEELNFNKEAGDENLWKKYYPSDRLYTVLFKNSNVNDVDKDIYYGAYFDVNSSTNEVKGIIAVSSIDNSNGNTMIFPNPDIDLVKDSEYKDSSRPEEDEEYPELKK